MNYDRTQFVFNDPVFVEEIGYVRFLKYKEYLSLIEELSYIKMNVLHVYHLYRKMLKDDKEGLEGLEAIKEESLIAIVYNQETFFLAYHKIFSAVLDINDKNDSWSAELVRLWEDEKIAYESVYGESSFEKTLTQKAVELIFSNEDLFMSFRQLILDMQMLVEDPVNPNPEIQAGIEASRDLKNQESDGLMPLDIVTSIVAGTSNSFEEVGNMTVLQVNSIFYRIGAFKNYDANIIFASVGADIKIEPWSQSIDLYKKEEVGIKEKEFNKKFGGMFG